MSASTAAGRTPLRPLDLAMLALATASVGLLCWETFWTPDEATRAWIVRADYAVCAIFAAEFLWRWRADGCQRQFVFRNWTDVLGMVPVSSPALRAFRLFRVVRIVTMFARVGRVADRSLGPGFTSRMLDRASRPLVNAISGSVTLAVLDEVGEVLVTGTYTRNVARALDENEAALRGMIAEKLRQNPRLGRLARLPFYGEIVESVTEAVLQLARDVLNDPRTDELVADTLRENLMQLRAAVKARREGTATPPQASTSAGSGADGFGTGGRS